MVLLLGDVNGRLGQAWRSYTCPRDASMWRVSRRDDAVESRPLVAGLICAICVFLGLAACSFDCCLFVFS